MMPRKKRKTLIIVAICILLIIIIAVFVTLYMTTDMFKSNGSLFAKYLKIGTENAEMAFKDPVGREYNELLNNNKYTGTTQVQANYTTNTGTTDETATNVINTLKLNINSQMDKPNSLDYRDISILKSNENILEVEYMKTADNVGVKFSDLFKQYLIVNGSDLNEVLNKSSIYEGNFILSQWVNVDLNSLLSVSDEDLEKINTNYSNATVEGISENNFSKEKNVVVSVDEKNYQANVYQMNLTKEQLNDIYINLLETLKEDEVVLSKIDEMESSITTNQNENENEEGTDENANTTSNSTTTPVITDDESTDNNILTKLSNIEGNTYREKFVNYIEGMITEIKNNNIGTEQCSIKVYENQKDTIRIEIQSDKYNTIIDTLAYTDGTAVFSIKVNDIVKDIDTFVFKIKKESDKISITCKTEENELSIGQNRTIENGKGKTNTTIDYAKDNSKISITIDDNKEVVNAFPSEHSFTRDNSLNLNELNEEQLANVSGVVTQNLDIKKNNLATQIDYNDFLNILKSFDIISEKVTIASISNLTTSEVNRFNAQFELYQGTGLEYTAVNSLMEVVKDNLETTEVVSSNVLKLNIVRGQVNHELADTINTIVNNETNNRKKFSIEMQYDDKTGIINAIVITMSDK